MEIKACLFDLDGVLVDTAKYHYLAWRELAEELGFEFTEDHNERLKGVSRMRSLDILLEVGGLDFEDSVKEKLAAQKNNRYVSLIERMTPDEILPGVKEFLEGLKNRKILLALGSASKNAPLILERTGLAGYFDAIVDGNLISKAKPDPEVFLKGAELLNVPPQNCVVFEDAASGIEAALNAGMLCIGVGDPEILNQANLIISGFSEYSAERFVNSFIA
ncbi:MAG: beta-phosphoglucomutase [Bacteroidota bacterium]|nr:beta-phosphoglucomutase [Bacteroidota bacterium]